VRTKQGLQLGIGQLSNSKLVPVKRNQTRLGRDIVQGPSQRRVNPIFSESSLRKETQRFNNSAL
jgi:hypothetical protein